MSSIQNTLENSVTTSQSWNTDEMMVYIKQNGDEIKDPTIMINFINGTKNGMYLQYGSSSVRDNETVVLVAFKFHGAAIMKASSRLQRKLETTARASKNPPDEAPCWVPLI